MTERKRTVLDEAADLVTGPRRRDYDHPLPNHVRISLAWLALIWPILDADVKRKLTEVTVETLDPRTAAAMMSAVKGIRDTTRRKRDNPRDQAGYALTQELMTEVLVAEGIVEPEGDTSLGEFEKVDLGNDDRDEPESREPFNFS